MKLKLWQVDAFADRPFAGNPAAVVPLQSWLSDETMQAIANENNLAETAFFVPHATGMGSYDLRWFTPTVEVPLCGHATLASGWVVLNELMPSADMVRFETKSGELTVAREGDGRLKMALPASSVDPFAAPRGACAQACRTRGRRLARRAALGAQRRGRKSRTGRGMARGGIARDAPRRRSCRSAREREGARACSRRPRATASPTISFRGSSRRAWACMRTR